MSQQYNTLIFPSGWLEPFVSAEWSVTSDLNQLSQVIEDVLPYIPDEFLRELYPAVLGLQQALGSEQRNPSATNRLDDILSRINNAIESRSHDTSELDSTSEPDLVNQSASTNETTSSEGTPTSRNLAPGSVSFGNGDKLENAALVDVDGTQYLTGKTQEGKTFLTEYKEEWNECDNITIQGSNVNDIFLEPGQATSVRLGDNHSLNLETNEVTESTGSRPETDIMLGKDGFSIERGNQKLSLNDPLNSNLTLDALWKEAASHSSAEPEPSPTDGFLKLPQMDNTGAVRALGVFNSALVHGEDYKVRLAIEELQNLNRGTTLKDAGKNLNLLIEQYHRDQLAMGLQTPISEEQVFDRLKFLARDPDNLESLLRQLDERASSVNT